MKKIKLKKKFKKEKNSKWLLRHLNDEYYIQSKKKGFRSRSAFKLIQINNKFKIFCDTSNVLDLGSAPGGWCQISKDILGKNAKILGIDILPIVPLEGVKFLVGDICELDMQKIISNYFTEEIDIILCDMAPNTIGCKSTDHLRLIRLVEISLDIVEKFLKKNGFFVCKIFQGGAQGKLNEELKKIIKNVKYFKPAASRKESSETYLIGQKK